MAFTYFELNNMAGIASRAAGAPEAGVAVTVINDVRRQAFAIWTVFRGKLSVHELQAECTSQERLNAHVAGFVANTQG